MELIVEQKSRLLVQRPRNMSRLQYAKMSSSSGCTDRYEMCGERKVSVPVLVVCFTNHALDQFLEGILKFCTKDGKIFCNIWSLFVNKVSCFIGSMCIFFNDNYCLNFDPLEDHSIRMSEVFGAKCKSSLFLVCHVNKFV